MTLGPRGATVSITRITGAREGHLASLERFEDEWIAFLGPEFDDALDEMRAVLLCAREADDVEDDEIP